MNDDLLSPQLLAVEPPAARPDHGNFECGTSRPIVLVLGMHRSGTSVCSHILSALAVDMADKIPGPGANSPHPGNPRGHWSTGRSSSFTIAFSAFSIVTIWGDFTILPCRVAWWADPRVAGIRREIVAFLQGAGATGISVSRTHAQCV